MTAVRTEKVPTSTPSRSGRRVWKKKTPVEVVLDQEQKLRQQIAEEETALEQKKRQLQKFEQARKIFETN